MIFRKAFNAILICKKIDRVTLNLEPSFLPQTRRQEMPFKFTRYDPKRDFTEVKCSLIFLLKKPNWQRKLFLHEFFNNAFQILIL